MAKRRSRTYSAKAITSQKGIAKRNIIQIPSRRLFWSSQALKQKKSYVKRLSEYAPLITYTTPNALLDRRRFDPTRPLARTTSGGRALLASKLNNKQPYLPYRVGFENPSQVITCVRRKSRREVLHALQIRGGSGNIQRKRKYRRTTTTGVTC